MIDEKKLLEKLGAWYGSLFPKTSIQDSIKCDVIDDVMTMIEDIEKVGEWIPISKSLPEIETEVIASCKDHITGYSYIDIDYRNRKDGKWIYFGQDVIAWQPLPKVFEGE